MLKRRVLFFIAPILLLLVVCSDVPVSNSLRLLAEADRFALLYNWPRATPLYEEAESRFVQSGDTGNALLAKLGHLWVTADSGIRTENTEAVRAILQLPLVQSDAKLKLRTLVAKAAIERDTNEVEAQKSWEEILNLATLLGDKQWEARAKAEMGQILYMEGNIKAATEMFREAVMSLYMHFDLGAALYYTAMVGNDTVETGRAETGLQYCSIVLRMMPFLKDSGFPFMAYQGKARALLALDRKTEAKSVLEEAIAHAQNENNNFAFTQLLVVASQAASDDSGPAIGYLKEATAMTQEKGFHHVYAWSAWELARRYRDIGDLNAAELAASEAISAMRDIEDRYHLPSHLALLADIEYREGNFRRADQLYDEATDVIEALLVNVNSRQVKASLIAAFSETYVGHFELAAKGLSNVGRAYEIIEQARGRSLADSLRGDSESLRSDAINLEAELTIDKVQLALLRETNSAKRQSLLDTLFVAEQLLSPVRRTNSPLDSSGDDFRPVPLKMLQRSLHSDEVLIEYVLAEPQSYCLKITANGSAVVAIPAGGKRIDDLVEKYLGAIRSRHVENAIDDELFSILLEPVLDESSKANRVIVVPDRKLHLLPFDALRDRQGRYLLESDVVTYAPSATVLYLLRTAKSSNPLSNSFLGVGGVLYPGPSLPNTNVPSTPAKPTIDGDFLDTGKLPSLPGTKEEVIKAAEIIGGNYQLLLGTNATEAAFKSLPLTDFRLIHLAVHGLVDNRFPDRGALVLSAGSGEDGLLQVREIRDLPMRADLVTLSACDTGTGSLLGEEGITSLENAFLLAGARAVIASLWTTDDWSTTFLVKHFYQHLSDGYDKGAALREAKLDLLKDFGDQARPVYWAGFTLVGEAATMLN